jgi:hypothetical protein
MRELGDQPVSMAAVEKLTFALWRLTSDAFSEMENPKLVTDVGIGKAADTMFAVYQDLAATSPQEGEPLDRLVEN